MIEFLAQVIGVIGVVLVLFAYFSLQKQWLQAKDIRYLLMNIFGPLFIILSLIVKWNLSAFLIEAVWLLISLASLYKVLKAKLTPHLP